MSGLGFGASGPPSLNCYTSEFLVRVWGRLKAALTFNCSYRLGSCSLIRSSLSCLSRKGLRVSVYYELLNEEPLSGLWCGV